MLARTSFKASNDLSNLWNEFHNWPAITKEKYDFDVDIIDKENSYEIKAYLPGIEREKIDVEYENGILKISSNKDESKEEKTNNYYRREHRVGQFSRSFKVDDLDGEKIEATLSNGVLLITLPKKQKPKSKITIR